MRFFLFFILTSNFNLFSQINSDTTENVYVLEYSKYTVILNNGEMHGLGLYVSTDPNITYTYYRQPSDTNLMYCEIEVLSSGVKHTGYYRYHLKEMSDNSKHWAWDEDLIWCEYKNGVLVDTKFWSLGVSRPPKKTIIQWDYSK